MTDEERSRLRDLLDALAAGTADRAARAGAARLLDAAVGDGTLRPGLDAAAVRALVGPPHFTRGDEADAEFGWGYPTLPHAGDEPKGAEWYLWLDFRDGVVERVRRRAWVSG
jgi:hypothetical protein